MTELNRRNLMKTSVAAALGASVTGTASAAEEPSDDTLVRGELKRLASTAFGAEVTGPFVIDGRTLVFSLQHPSDSERNVEKFRKGGIGYVDGFDVSGEFEELGIPKSTGEQGKVRTAAGSYELLAREKQPINGGTERLGVPKTPDGTPIDTFAGSKYSAFGNDPDMNQFVATAGGEYDGFLFTNFEQSPGTLSRMPLTVGEDGSLTPDLENTTNLANTDAMRAIGGTRINCYGDLSPWGTPLSAEEEYSHAKVSLDSTVTEMVEDSGIGRRGASEFWNRPNPAEIQGKVGDYFGEGWYVQGYFALTGVELLAYHLGARPVDQNDEKTVNDHTPIGMWDSNDASSYPNRYDYGYIVDFRNPTAEDPGDIEPVKYYVMGRGSWEAPDIQNDLRTAYLTSDGSNKGIYKFVADRPIPSYSDPMDVAGTLYAPLVTNKEAAQQRQPKDVDLEIEWLEMGSATNREVKSWIDEYDDITQVDYLNTHAETNWRNDLETALEEADREVVKNGNRDYITDQEVLDWAEQYRQNGPDGVDEELRRVPFLETRAAAKEIGATIEFRKAEGIDSVDNATPGDYVYIGLSEVNDGLADDEGKIQMTQTDGGMVYRAELEPDYNISTLEPAIVGPNSNDPADIADDALLNIDNVWVMDDGRVLCCEDADQLSRSYPNDCMYVFTPDQTRSPGRSTERGNRGGNGRGA